MQILDLKATWIWYMYSTFADNFVFKFWWSILAIFISQIYLPNETMIKLIIFWFLVNFITWVLKAIRNRVFRISIFAKWMSKLMLYWIFMMICFSVDTSLWVTFFLPMIFAYISLTDAWSILENIEELWIDIPKPLLVAFKIHKQKFFYDKLKIITWWDLLFDYQKDFQTMKDWYIPMIKNETFRKMFCFKIQILEWFVSRLVELPVNDAKYFKVNFALLLETAWKEIEERLEKEHFRSKDIEVFLNRHYSRVKELVSEIDNILSNDDWENLVQVKNNLIQAIVRIIYNWIWDNIIWSNDAKYQLIKQDENNTN